MDTIIAIPPALQTPRQHPDAPVILVRVLIPSDQAHRFLYPGGNRVGTHLLCKGLETAMEAAQVRVSYRAFALDFNRAFVTFRASNPKRGMETIKEQFKQLSLLDNVQIAWHDFREGIQRPYHPAGVQFEMPSSAEVERFVAETNAAMRQLAQAERKNDEPTEC